MGNYDGLDADGLCRAIGDFLEQSGYEPDTRPTKPCQRCGQAFHYTRSTARFCSSSCRQSAHHNLPLPDPDRTCDQCGIPIGRKRANARFCSPQCRSLWDYYNGPIRLPAGAAADLQALAREVRPPVMPP